MDRPAREIGGTVDKLAMVSIILATVAVPVFCARDRDGRRGVRRMVLLLFAFNAVYLAYLTMIHATYFVPQRW